MRQRVAAGRRCRAMAREDDRRRRAQSQRAGIRDLDRAGAVGPGAGPRRAAAAAWSAAVLAYRTSVGVTSVARTPTIVTTTKTSGNANPRAFIRRTRPSTS